MSSIKLLQFLTDKMPLKRCWQSGFFQALRHLLSPLLVASLAACGGGNTDGDSDSTAGSTSLSTQTEITATPACTVAPDLFVQTVWPTLSTACMNCHVSTGAAGGTGLVFSHADATTNYNILRNFAANNSELLLSKSIGKPNHAGGSPLGNAQSASYNELATLVATMANQVCTTTPTRPTKSSFFRGVTFASDSTLLSRAAVLFAGRNATAAEVSAVTNGDDLVLRQTIRNYMQGPAFDAFLNEVGDTHFLTPGVNPRNVNTGLDEEDWPGLKELSNASADIRGRFDASVRREPIELMKSIVTKDGSWKDMVTGKYTMVNHLTATYLNARLETNFVQPNNDNEFVKATLPNQRGENGMREHAGVLSTHAWLQRFPTTSTNRNRHRVYTLMQQFLATDLNALAISPIDVTGSHKVPTVENPNCAACHATMDPMAAGFQNWDSANRYRPNLAPTGYHALPSDYLSRNYPKNANNQSYYRVGDNWFRDQAAPGYSGVSMPGRFEGNLTALQWLAGNVASDPRYAMGGVYFWYLALFGRPPLKAPAADPNNPLFSAQQAAYSAQHEELEAIAARFATNRGHGAFNVRDLLVDLVISAWFSAELSSAANNNATRQAELADLGSVNLLPPGALNRKLVGVAGQGWTEFNNPYSNMGVTYGDFDGVVRTNRAKSYTMMQLVIIDRLSSLHSCNITKADFDKSNMTSRLLFPMVTLRDLPNDTAGQAAIKQNILHLHKVLWKENVNSNNTEVKRTLKLFNDVWGDRGTPPTKSVTCAYNNNNDPNYTGRAWATVISYMLGDPKFLYE